LEDQLLTDFHASIKRKYPNLQFRAIGVNFGTEGYLDAIVSGTTDLDVSLLFNNAGYVAIGLFADLPIEKQIAHIECNALSSVKITHHFLNLMLSKKLKGAIVFTSSPAGQMPCPFSIMYGATKAFITEFGASLAGEVYADGIDVQVLHPSPVDTNFYKVDSASKSGMLNLFSKTATSPTIIAETVFATLGRGVVRDQGYFVLLRYLMLIFDFGAFTFLTAITARFTSEYKNLTKRD
jgi:short-subunit dehydrogenase